jgi:aminoglycoside/choline kinase family phosphotransferase
VVGASYPRHLNIQISEVEKMKKITTGKTYLLKTLKSKLTDFFKTDRFSLAPIEGGASVRKYFILQFQKNSRFPTNPAILMYIPQERIDIADNYHNISQYFSRMNISQPPLYEVHRKKGWLFVEHAAGYRLDLYLQNTTKDETSRIYHRLVDFLLDLQNHTQPDSDCWAFERFFDSEKYQFEFSFHLREQLLENYFQHRLSDSEQQVFTKATLEISEFLDNHLPVFVHRDFQSSNIFYHPESTGNIFQIIDFQDARSGGPMYDLVALLWDSYYSLTKNLQEELLQKFYLNQSLVNKNFSLDKYQQTIDYSVIQRKLHDAGAFVYSYRLTGNDRYLKYIQPAIQMAVSRMKYHSNLNNFRNLLLDIVAKNHA